MKKQKTFVLAHEEALKSVLAMVAQSPLDCTIEVVVRPVKISKTLAQLGALFGCWIKYISEQTGDDEKYLHRKLKAGFLARIYCIEPEGDAQEQWVELLAHYQESGEQEKLHRHAKRISLTWASINQMKAYMNAVENYYINNGYPLPILDKFRKSYQ